MRKSAFIVASIATATTVANAQLLYNQANITQIAQKGLAFLSTGCQTAVKELISPKSPTGQCLNTSVTSQILYSNDSAIPGVDKYLGAICTSNPCTSSVLQNVTKVITTSCSSDLKKFGWGNDSVAFVVQQYPLAREILCLKTNDPYSSIANSTGANNSATGGAASTTSDWYSATDSASDWSAGGKANTGPSSSAFSLMGGQAIQNSSVSQTLSSSASTPTATGSASNGSSTPGNSEYCVTSVITELFSYLGNTSLTLNDVATIALGGNATAIQTIMSIPPTALCNDCVFAAVTLVEAEFPDIGTSVSINGSTANDWLNHTCSASGLQLSGNGTLPTNITSGASNSSFPYNFTDESSTHIPSSTAAPIPVVSIVPQIGGDKNATIGNTTVGIGHKNSTISMTSAALTASTSVSATSANPSVLKKRWIGEQ
ncbi:uncharacterized protein L203_101339 [Cryptococcus depauperatus CBS 7841]|uniref:Uncharacterized protein n=1 Tax=Cryptococcus depauperatus CBS 7841 TaxID=1295531 RepID=A0AAJ8JPT8_9TREE